MDERLSQIAAESDFARERRKRALSKIAARLRFEPDDVVAPGCPSRKWSRRWGSAERVVTSGCRPSPSTRSSGASPAAAVSSTAASSRPPRACAGAVRRSKEAPSRGAAMPPIDVYRIGDLHFVKDGHHRVSVARAFGDDTIEADVVEVRTRLGAGRSYGSATCRSSATSASSTSESPCPLGRATGSSSRTNGATPSSRPWSRRGASRESRRRPAAVTRGDRRDLVPRGIRAGRRSAQRRRLGGNGPETERYLRIAMLRYLLLQTHDWTEEIVEHLLGEVRSDSQQEDTMVHQILKEMK